MLFWIFVMLLIVGIVLWFVGCAEDIFGVVIAGVFATVIGAIVVLASVGIIAQEEIEAGAKIEGYKARYESLVYQYENDLYENDNDVGKRELIADIESWNSDLAYRKAMQHNFWVGIYWADIYDEFEFIPMTK